MTTPANHSTGDNHERRFCELEKRYATLSRFVDELNEVVIEQDKRLMKLEREFRELVKQTEPGSVAPANDRPPHY